MTFNLQNLAAENVMKASLKKRLGGFITDCFINAGIHE